jgi:hypothetical protein
MDLKLSALTSGLASCDLHGTGLGSSALGSSGLASCTPDIKSWQFVDYKLDVIARAIAGLFKTKVFV